MPWFVLGPLCHHPKLWGTGLKWMDGSPATWTGIRLTINTTILSPCDFSWTWRWTCITCTLFWWVLSSRNVIFSQHLHGWILACFVKVDLFSKFLPQVSQMNMFLGRISNNDWLILPCFCECHMWCYDTWSVSRNLVIHPHEMTRCPRYYGW